MRFWCRSPTLRPGYLQRCPARAAGTSRDPPLVLLGGGDGPRRAAARSSSCYHVQCRAGASPWGVRGSRPGVAAPGHYRTRADLRAQFRPQDHAETLMLTQTRGKKTKAAVELPDVSGDATKSSLPIAQSGGDDVGPAYPTVVLQARRNMQKFDNCVLLTRVGGFYELYFEHASEYGPLLNLKVAEKKTSAGPVPMAGFPFFQLDRFLKILVQDLNRYVAVAEEFPNDASERVRSGGLMHDRRVARIITPGTLIDENFMDPYANNYVMAIHLLPSAQPAPAATSGTTSPNRDEAGAVSLPLGLAWLDLSTGHFYTQTTNLASLPSILARISPREIVLDQGLRSDADHAVFSVLAEDKHLVTYTPSGDLTALADWAPILESELPPSAAEAFTAEEIRAGSLLLQYVKGRLQGMSMKLQPPLRHEHLENMTIDKNSMRSLEIKQTIRDGAFRGSLLHAIRRTVTKSGARLLNEWLNSPSTSKEVINSRQDLVACFIKNETLRERIILLLKRSHDSQRLVQKFALGRGDPDDLLALAATTRATDDIVALLRSAQVSAEKAESYTRCLTDMIDRISLEGPLNLARRIADAVDEDGLVQQHQIDDSDAGEMMALAQEVVSSEGSAEDGSVLPKTAARKKKPVSIRDYYGEDNEAWIMRPQASPGLAGLHEQVASLLQDKARLAEELQQRLGAPSLTLKWTPGLGHICHVKGKDTAKSPAEARPVSSSRTTRSFHLPEWTQLGRRLDQARFHIHAEEQRVLHTLREQVIVNLVRLRRNAAVLDELDITTSFARLALEQGWTRPHMNNSTTTLVMGGRHPTVEGGLYAAGRSFTRNDCAVGAGGRRGQGSLWLITGPNMAGKSTFLRQNALITILAQIGCYVPAEHAELGIVDAVFSRVGSADDLFRNQSTFMVEMLETAEILRRATPRSFVVMDEIGRGTTPEDGAAVAFAAVHHLVRVNRCRTLFATHFHALADLVTQHGMCAGDADAAGTGAGGVEMYCTDVEEDGRCGFVYVHKLRKGVNRQSHALKVARLAGLPEPAMKVARQVLEGTFGVKDQAEQIGSETNYDNNDNNNTAALGEVAG